MRSLQQKAVEEERKVRVLKRNLIELRSSQVPSKRQRCSTRPPTKSRKVPSFSKIEGAHSSNRVAQVRRVCPAGMDKIPEIVASEHFNELLWQFQCLDECKCNCVFGRSVKIHLLHRQLDVKQLELAQLECKLREAENKAF